MSGTLLIQFRLSGDDADLTRRRATGQGVSPNLIVKTDLERAWTLLADTVPPLTQGEALLIMDALNSSSRDWSYASLIWASVEDAERDERLGAKWDVDIPALVTRVRALSQVQAIALTHAVDVAWDLASGPEAMELPDAARRAGLGIH